MRHYLDRKSWDEIAAGVGGSAVTVRKRAQRAKEKIRQLLTCRGRQE
jgi:DNA-directed RNA polymerase specialized sigma24 family protein